MKDKIFIGKREISQYAPAFIIGELSANHNQDFDLAIKTVDAMFDAGVDCLKLQTAKPDSITLDCDNDYFKIKGGTIWDGKTFFELYTKVYTPWEWHKPLKEYAESKGMLFFSSPFSHEAVDFLEELDVPAYKIASFEITDIPLIKYAASKGKPIIISTGIAEEDDIQCAVEACLEVGNDNVILLKCTSSYPTPLEEVNLNAINTIKEKFNCIVGLSDHTIGTLVPIGAVAFGARVIEKHFILDRKLGGPDAEFSSNPNEFKDMIKQIRNLEKSFGTKEIVISDKVKESKKFARSLFIVEDVKNGDVLNSSNIRSIRPGHGLHPKNYEDVLGKKFIKNVSRGTPLSYDLIE